MSILFTEQSSINGDEPPGLLKLLAWEYIAELNRLGMVQLLELTGANGQPTLLVVISNAKVEGDKIVEVVSEAKP